MEKLRNLSLGYIILLALVGMACIPLAPEGAGRLAIFGVTVAICTTLTVISQNKNGGTPNAGVAA